jgi:hypothetical protein
VLNPPRERPIACLLCPLLRLIHAGELAQSWRQSSHFPRQDPGKHALTLHPKSPLSASVESGCRRISNWGSGLVDHAKRMCTICYLFTVDKKLITCCHPFIFCEILKIMKNKEA